MSTHCLLVAKAPVPGEAKTRLGATIGMAEAAELAALALLDTIESCGEAFPGRCHLALAGDLTTAVRAEELIAATTGWEVFAQVGQGFGERLAHAHRRASVPADALVVQVGMDTPQLTAGLLLEVADLAERPGEAALGLATDGGWWVLALREAEAAAALAAVPMSTPTTGLDTARELALHGLNVLPAPVLTDVDTVIDAAQVAALAPWTRFARRWSSLEQVS